MNAIEIKPGVFLSNFAQILLMVSGLALLNFKVIDQRSWSLTILVCVGMLRFVLCGSLCFLALLEISTFSIFRPMA